MPTNAAAWQIGPQVKPLQVKSAPYTTPRENEIVIKNAAVAINPLDHVLQEAGTALSFPWLRYPFIPGIDVAGEVVEIGSGVTRFNVGDRAVGYAVGMDKNRNEPAGAGFQLYTVLLAHMTTPIPSSMLYEEACVIPMGVSTAACGLFQEDQLGLQLHSQHPKPTGKTVLIWGGSTSVGSNAIQLAVAAGYEKITTCSPKNFAYVKQLGASQAFDYNSSTVITDIIEVFKGKLTAGALSIGPGSADACMTILHKCSNNSDNDSTPPKSVAMATYPVPSPMPKSFPLLKTVYTFMSWSIAAYMKTLLWSWGLGGSSIIKYKFIFGTTLVDNGIGQAVYEDFLPKALAQGTYVAAPPLLVVGKGLEMIQEAIERQARGVSAAKVVVLL